MTSEEYIKEEIGRFLKKHSLDLPVILDRPKEIQFGDYASNIAMQLARPLKKAPAEIARQLLDEINLDPQYISNARIDGPGFINFSISSANLYIQLAEILIQAGNYGFFTQEKPLKAQIEFVSANPTGPLTIGHGRQAVLGDTVANILEAAGYHVTREYYFNDAGRQMRVLGQSVKHRYLELCGQKSDFPDDHYQGEYITDIARALYDTHGDALKDTEPIEIFKEAAQSAIFEDIKKTIKKLGFKFDVFFNEKSLYDDGKIEQTVSDLKAKGLVYEKEGATWFETTKIGFDQDRVIIKSTGEPTYRLPDIAYHIEKFKRNFDLIIDIFGADHIDTYPDVLAALKVLGYEDTKVRVLIHQFVTLTENGQIVKMSTRKANFVTLDELIDEVGRDVTRYFFLMRGMNSHLNFDISLAKTQSDENPVYYIQYAHARICSILRVARERKSTKKTQGQPLLNKLVKQEEVNLIKELIMLPETVKNTALALEPHKLVNYLFNLASLFHKFYTECRVISEDQELTQARLTLIDATRVVIANALKILGLSAPVKM